MPKPKKTNLNAGIHGFAVKDHTMEASTVESKSYMNELGTRSKNVPGKGGAFSEVNTPTKVFPKVENTDADQSIIGKK